MPTIRLVRPFKYSLTNYKAGIILILISVQKEVTPMTKRLFSLFFSIMLLASTALGIFSDQDVVEYDLTDITPFSTVPLYGDVDGDGVIDAADITLLRRYIAAEDKILFKILNPRFNEENADVDGDRIISAADLARLRQYVAGFTVLLGPLNVIPLSWDALPGGSSIPVSVWVPFLNTPWNVQGGGSWLTTDPSSGNGPRSFTLRADPNTTTSARTGTLVVNAQLSTGIVSRTVTVTQQPMPRVNFTFNLQGGTFNGSTSNVVISSIPGMILNRPSPNPTRTGHILGGWYTSASYTTLAPTAAPASPTTYHARWHSSTVTGISVSPHTAMINVGERIRLNATVFPSYADQSAIWMVLSGSNVAEVDDNGWVRGLSPGSAAINARPTTSFGFSSNATIGVSRPPREYGQNKTLWCWAAAAKMAGEHNSGRNWNSGAAVLTDTDGRHSFNNQPFFGLNHLNQFTADAGQWMIVASAYGNDGNHTGNSVRIQDALRLVAGNRLWGWIRGNPGSTNTISQGDINFMNAELAAGRYVVASVITLGMPSPDILGHAIVIQSYNAARDEYTYYDPRRDGYYNFTTDELLNGAINIYDGTLSVLNFRLRYFVYTFQP
jgi:hypothetical protein